MRSAKIAIVVLAILCAGLANAIQVSLYKVELTSGTSAYRFAGAHNWPIYYAEDNVAVVGMEIGRRDLPEISSISFIYRGPSEKLRWISSQKWKNKADYNGKALFRHGETALVESNTISTGESKAYGNYMVRAFSEQPISVNTDSKVANPSISRDSSIAALCQSISIEHFQATVETLQAFLNRNANGPYDDSAAAWLMAKFQSFGIGDVKLDTFTFQSWYIENDTYKFRTDTCHNVIATVPGTLDTNVTYVVGGHYDTSVWLPGDTLATRGPGADDNGSGTAAAVEMARIFATAPPHNTTRFVAFDCEEFGLFGSNKAASDERDRNTNIGCMLNYDMIANLGNDSLFNCYQYSGSEYMGQLLGQCAIWYGTTSDTNLVPKYVNSNSSGSDSWEYWNLGFPVTYSEEYYFSPNWHLVTDSTTNMNMRYGTSIIRAGFGLLATIANYPQKVSGLTASDIGNGSQLYVQWQPNRASNITGYKVYWGKSTGVYTDSTQTTDTSDTIGNLTADTICYIGLIAIDNEGKESPLVSEISATPRSVPLAPAGLIAQPVDSALTISWQKNKELDLAGYVLYRRIDSGGYDSLSAGTDSSYADEHLSGSSKYYYKVRSFDGDGNYSSFSDSAYGRPITLDQGVLVVDETYWSSGLYPNDAKQDSFYNYIMAGYKVTEYEYDSIQHKPILADFGPYSVVVWHGDDNNSLWASYAMNDLRSYFDAGGKVWFVGWKPSGNVRNNAAYPADFGIGSMMYDEFLVSHAELSGSADSFKAATGLKGYPDLNIDTLKYPATIFGKTFRSIEALTPTGTGDTIYVMDMKNNSSLFEGRACAVRDSGKAVFFGFPMYFMDREQAKLAAQKVLEEFGEEPVGVSGGREGLGLVTGTRLFQNSPNPFARQTTISYQLPKAGNVSINIYNVTGQLVKTLVSGRQGPGTYTVIWNGDDNSGAKVSNGVYVYKLETLNGMSIKKMVVLR